LTKTDLSKVFQVDKGAKIDGKKKLFSYIKWGSAAMWLDENYPGWSFEVVPESFRENAGSINCIGKLTVYEPNGLMRIMMAAGNVEINTKKDGTGIVALDYWKVAETDAFKRCVARLGGFNDLYADEVFEEYSNEIDKLFNEVFPVLIEKALEEKHKFNFDNVAKVLISYFRGNITIQRINELLGEL